MGILAAFSILAEEVISCVDELMQQRGAPVFLRSDNGSEFTAEAVQPWLASKSVGPVFILSAYHSAAMGKCFPTFFLGDGAPWIWNLVQISRLLLDLEPAPR